MNRPTSNHFGRGDRMKRNKTLHEKIMKSKDIDEIFDLVCAANYFAGNFD